MSSIQLLERGSIGLRGSALVKEGLAQADESGRSCYLETSEGIAPRF